VAAVQPVLILEETPSPKQAPGEAELSDKSDKPSSTEPLPIKQPKI